MSVSPRHAIDSLELVQVVDVVFMSDDVFGTVLKSLADCLGLTANELRGMG